jgi:hypothetical protein
LEQQTAQSQSTTLGGRVRSDWNVGAWSRLSPSSQPFYRSTVFIAAVSGGGFFFLLIVVCIVVSISRRHSHRRAYEQLAQDSMPYERIGSPRRVNPTFDIEAHVASPFDTEVRQ